MFPDIFKWFVGVPWLLQLVAIDFEVVGGEEAVGCAEMLEDLNDRDIGVAKDVFLEILQVNSVNWIQNLLFDAFFDCLTRGEICHTLIVGSVGSSDLGSSSSGEVDWRMKRFTKLY